jgi:hypothetical protein
LHPYNRQKYLILPAQIEIVEPSFNIQDSGGTAGQTYWLAEAGPQGLSLVAANWDTRTVTHCMAWHFAAGTTDAEAAVQLTGLLDRLPLLQQPWQKAELLYGFAKCVPTPAELYRASDAPALLQQVYGDVAEGPVRSDFVYRHNLHNVYQVPDALAQWAPKGGQLVCGHGYSSLLNSFTGSTDALWAIFYPHSVTVLLRKGAALQLVQQYAYQAPEDAAWHLLAVCHQFGMAAAELPVTLYGMIDAQSALYAELYKYFGNLAFAALPEGLQYPTAMAQYPPHFFSHLFTALLCV